MARRMAGRKYRCRVLGPRLCRRRVIAPRQQLQLKRPPGIHKLRRCGHFGGHLQTQQSLLRCLRLACRPCRQHRPPLRTGAGRLLGTQCLRGWNGLRIALFPGGHQLHHYLAVGLYRHAVERLLRPLQRLTLGAKSGVTQAGWRGLCGFKTAAAPVVCTPAKTSTRTRAVRTATRPARRATARAVPGTIPPARTASLWATAGARSGGCIALLAGAVIAPPRHYRRSDCGLRRDLDRRKFCGRRVRTLCRRFGRRLRRGRIVTRLLRSFASIGQRLGFHPVLIGYGGGQSVGIGRRGLCSRLQSRCF